MSSNDARSEYKAQVLAATDIVAVIGRSVALKKRGKDYLGLCPFHQEKSPSFSVSQSKQFFYCYGCKASGNVIDYVIRRDRLEFRESLELLGKEAGITPPKFTGSGEKQSQTQALMEANSAACAFFERVLAQPEPGAVARALLQKRGFNTDSIKRFQVGVAPEGWDGLVNGPVGRKFKPDVLFAAGLVKKRERGEGFYDSFRNRLIFPIRDEGGRVIAFGGRRLVDSDNPKYLNSPETPLFSKSRSIYGLDLARQKIIESRTVVVVEGYTDVVMAHQFGATNVVSILGTAMTEQHVAKLRRYLPDDGTGRIVLLFDADTAGDLAADRTVGLFLTQPVEIKIASMPPDVDPDEYLLKEGAGAFERLIESAPDALTYKWTQLVRRLNANGSSLTGQQKAVEEYLKTLAEARGSGSVDSLRWGTALARVSRLTEMSVEQLNRRFRGAGNSAGGARGRAGSGPAQVAGADQPMNASPARRGTMSARDRAERRILGALLLQPAMWTNVQKVVQTTDFTDDLHRRLAEAYWDYQRDEGEPVFNEFLGVLGDSALQELSVEVLDEIESLPDVTATVNEAVSHLNEERKRHEQQKLVAACRRTSEQPIAEQDEEDLLRRLQESARRPDLRRA